MRSSQRASLRKPAGLPSGLTSSMSGKNTAGRGSERAFSTSFSKFIPAKPRACVLRPSRTTKEPPRSTPHTASPRSTTARWLLSTATDKRLSAKQTTKIRRPTGIPQDGGSSFFLVIEHTVTVALEIGIGYLAAEFKTGAFYVLAFSHTAGAVAAFGFKPLLHRPDDLLVLIQSDLHTPRTVRLARQARHEARRHQDTPPTSL